ncbi:hypothetical protein GYMLUDRAFT_230368 [Collybiopsis luxurians FD-317 M1]|uniref:Uncharacterized protein n=1 Tax=Collybiopsis luxurians FD-317 M1 TaxID=944289 RepID=A0A0D0CDZ4_9AGAR|nr:hypothetical protein GYMLUDRAFT_230368 [Collybiopsis luxurians FD-317 M1]
MHGCPYSSASLFYLLSVILLPPLVLAANINLDDNSTAPYIFNELYSLLIHWPNTFHPNGHTIVPGELEPYTLLYHARKDPQVPPPSPEWLAFDPEMSYAVMASKIPGPTYLYTYRTVKSAKVLYFNGMSAAWGDGWLDTQYSVITGKGKTNGSREREVSLWDDYGRARALCEWGRPRGFDGIVRMNAGFEIIWCDFQSPLLSLISSLNITPPGTPEAGHSFPFPPDDKFLVQTEGLDEELPSRPPRWPGRRPGGPGRSPGGDGGGPWGFEMAPLARSGNMEWMRAAVRHHSIIQPHLSLSYSGLVTFYHPRYQSLVPSRVGKRMQEHFPWEHASDEDVDTFLSELDLAVSGVNGPGTGFNWQSAALDVVAFWASRISQLDKLLGSVNGTSNLTLVIKTVQQLSYSPLDPFIAYGEALNASGHEIFFDVHSSPSIIPDESVSNTTALQRCISSATAFLAFPELRALMTPQEHVLKKSYETVLERLCTDFGKLFAESTDMLSSSVPEALMISTWHKRVKSLMTWLEWSAWLRCDEICDRDSVCSMPLWPIAWVGGPFGRPGKSIDADMLRPTCRRLNVDGLEAR